MREMMSTKMTKGGQTTVPKEIRTALGIGDTARVYWTVEGDRAYLSASPVSSLSIASEDDFWSRIAEAERSVELQGTRDAMELSAEVKDKYGIA